MNILDTLVKKFPTVSRCIIEAFLVLGVQGCVTLKNTFRIWRLQQYHKLDDWAMKNDRLGAMGDFMKNKYKLDALSQRLKDFDQDWNKLPIKGMIEGCPPLNDFFNSIKSGASALDTNSIQSIRDKIDRAEHLTHLALSLQTKAKMAERSVEDFIDKLSTYIDLLDAICGGL